jgi:hypothetical protein
VEEPELLEKWLWTEADFDHMGWHDSRVHAIAFLPDEFELCFDLDYIVQWVDPVPPASHYSFWVAPATLVFENVWDFKMAMDNPTPAFDIFGIERSDEQPSPEHGGQFWSWTIDGVEGKISFRSSGYKQYVRRPPQHITSQVLDWEERGGLSFDRATPTVVSW